MDLYKLNLGLSQLLTILGTAIQKSVAWTFWALSLVFEYLAEACTFLAAEFAIEEDEDEAI